MAIRECEVVVVGGGVVGAAAARALGRAGFDTLLLERGAAPAPPEAEYDLRVYAIAPKAQQFLSGLGAWSAIADARVSPYAAMQVWEREAHQGLRLHAADAGRNELGWIVEHSLLVTALWDGLDRERCIIGSEIESVEWDGDGALLHLEGGDEIRCRLVVAADGADSQIRQIAGIPCRAWRYPQRAIVGHVRTELPHLSVAYQRFLRTGPLAFLPLADGCCSIVWSADVALANALQAMDENAFCRRLETASEHALGTITAISARRDVPLQFLHAETYCAASLVLIGDAAHVIHPLAGQGVNLGLGDAEDLVGSLVATRSSGRDWAASRTLERYARARRARNQEMVVLTDSLYRAFGRAAPGIRGLLGVGLDALNHAPQAREWLARRASGAGG